MDSPEARLHSPCSVGGCGEEGAWRRKGRGGGRGVAEEGAWRRKGRGGGRGVAEEGAWRRKGRGGGRGVVEEGGGVGGRGWDVSDVH